MPVTTNKPTSPTPTTSPSPVQQINAPPPTSGSAVTPGIQAILQAEREAAVIIEQARLCINNNNTNMYI